MACTIDKHAGASFFFLVFIAAITSPAVRQCVFDVHLFSSGFKKKASFSSHACVLLHVQDWLVNEYILMLIVLFFRRVLYCTVRMLCSGSQATLKAEYEAEVQKLKDTMRTREQRRIAELQASLSAAYYINPLT